MSKLEKILIVPDSHIPYHDKKAFNLMLKAAKGFKPDVIVTLGDFADFYSVSSHSKDPNRVRDLGDEVDAVNRCLDLLDGLGAKKKIFISGNHEDRLERFLQDKAPELFNIVKIKNLFNLKERNWTYVPYKQHTKIGKLNFTHDVGTCGKYSVFSALSTYQHNIAFGHVHRTTLVVEGNATGEVHIGATFGWLGDENSVDYMHKIKVARDWSKGFGTAYHDLKTGNVYIVPITIIKNRCIIEGKLYDGK